MSGSEASKQLYILYQPFYSKLCQPFDRQGVFSCVPMQLVVEHAVCNVQGEVLRVLLFCFHIMSFPPFLRGRLFLSAEIRLRRNDFSIFSFVISDRGLDMRLNLIYNIATMICEEMCLCR